MLSNVPFFELKRVYTEQKAEVDAAVARVLESGWYILGKEDEAFEKEFSATLGFASNRAVSCNSGTDAIILPLITAGIGRGDEVVVPSHTAIPTVTAIRSTGATPVFADVNAETWVVDSAAVGACISSKTKAVVAVHLYGNMVDLSKLSVASPLFVLEDVAQAQGSTLNGAPAGTLGRFGAFSFYPSKNVGALGDGGAVVAHSDADFEALRMLRNYGQRDRYNAERDRGLNSRLDEIQAAILRVRLPKLSEWNKRKAKMMEIYRAELKNIPLTFQKVTEGCVPSWHLAVVALENQTRRDALMAHLKKAGVDTLIHYPTPTHLQKAFADFNTRALPVTESLASRIVSLPMNSTLTEGELEYTITQIQKFFRI